MTIPEILNALEGLRDLTNDNGKSIIDSVKPAIRRLIDPDELQPIHIRQSDVVEEGHKEEPKEDIHHKTAKKKK